MVLEWGKYLSTLRPWHRPPFRHGSHCAARLALLRYNPKSRRVQQPDNRLYSGDRDEDTSVFEAVVEGAFSSIPWDKVMERVVHILDLVDSVPGVIVLIISCIKAKDMNSRAHIVIIALDDLQLIIVVRAGCRKPIWGSSWTQGASFFACSTCTRQQSIHPRLDTTSFVVR